ncbi:MAG: acyl-CoA desaturase [bacterium]|nr:acyl-CoA desaturase [bacterium]
MTSRTQIENPTPKRSIVWSNAAFLTLTPPAAIITATWYAVSVGITWIEVTACVALWIVVGLSVTAGYHRLFSHRAYQASFPVRLFFALFGAAAWENSIIAWAAAHRFHHRHVDSQDDPYNPQEGFWYSHMGWIMVEGSKHDDTSNVPDLWKDPICRWQHKYYLAVSTVTNLAITIGLGLITGRMLGMFIFALLVRVVLTHHFTFLINSAAHIWGSQRWSTAHSAKDNWFLSFFTFGEGYHNYHHSFQADYRNGALWYNWDPSKWLIWLLSRLGLAQDLRRSHVDIRLQRLFAEAQRQFSERFDSLEEAFNEFRERAQTAMSESPLSQLRQQFASAEERCEQTLEELKAVRSKWQATLRTGGNRLPESRNLKRQLKRTHRQARSAQREWQRLGQAYLATAAATVHA